MKQKAISQFLITILAALVLWFAFKKPARAAIAFVLALIILFTGFLAPAIFARIDQFGKVLGEFVATALSWVLLVPFFYIVCGLSKLYLLLRRTDPLERTFPTTKSSYWKPYRAAQSRDNFRRQF